MGQGFTKDGSEDNGKHDSHQASIWAMNALGEDILGRIIHFAVVQQTPITFQYRSTPSEDALPGAAAFDHRIREWSQRIYLEENVFKFTQSQVFSRWAKANRGHAMLLRRVHVKLNAPTWETKPLAQALKLCKGIKELHLEIDEESMVHDQCKKSRGFQEERTEDVDHQMNLQLLHCRGMDDLRQLRFPNVSFALSSRQGEGAIPGGVLQTLVAKEMMMPLPHARPTPSQKRKPEKVQADDDDEYLPPGKQASAKRKRVKNNAAIRQLGKPLKRTESRCPLLELPAELRNRIFSLVLRVDGKINPSKRGAVTHINPGKSSRHHSSPEVCSVLALLQTCKQIHLEAFSFYYSTNTFVFYYPIQIFTFLQSISDKRKNCIRDVILWTENRHQGGLSFIEAAFMALTTLRSLQELQVNLDYRVVYQNGRGILPGYDYLKSLSKNGVKITLRSSSVERVISSARSSGGSPFVPDRKAMAKIISWQEGLDKF